MNDKEIINRSSYKGNELTRSMDHASPVNPSTLLNRVKTPVSMNPSPEGLEFILKKETGGPRYYEKRLARPSWPGVCSGITIGVGYDLKHHTKEQIRADWKPYISPDNYRTLGRS